MPPGEQRGSATVGVHGKKIYLAGGMRTLEPIGEMGEQDTVDFVTAFDTENMSWCTLPPFARSLPEGRDHAGGSVASNNFYVIGGRERGQRNVKDTVFTLDLDNLEGGWIMKESRMPTARGGVVTGTVNGKIYIFGAKETQPRERMECSTRSRSLTQRKRSGSGSHRCLFPDMGARLSPSEVAFIYPAADCVREEALIALWTSTGQSGGFLLSFSDNLYAHSN
ncbi:kelch repeat-containing protein [Colletotrichum tofieldiae]|nr:kelch repeat-containing protein [Colletotrichum tofieldiae]